MQSGISSLLRAEVWEEFRIRNYGNELLTDHEQAWNEMNVFADIL